MLLKLSNLNSNLALTLGYLNPALNNSVQFSEQDANFARFRFRSRPGTEKPTPEIWSVVFSK